MILLTPQSIRENAPQAARRTVLPTGSLYRCFLAGRLANALVEPAKTGNRNALGLLRANKPGTQTAIPGLLHVPDADHGNTFRKGSRSAFNVPKV